MFTFSSSIGFAYSQKELFSMWKQTSPFLDCDNGRSCHAECELRHLDECEKALRNTSFSSPTRLVLCAGPERSGSTWLYNAVRLLMSAAQVPCDSYWIHQLSKSKLEERLKEGRFVLVKTHKYYSDYNDWLFGFNPVILLTHRDLRDVLASYIRVGWTSDIPESYVQHHLQWRNHASLDLSYEEIVSNAKTSLVKIASTVGLESRVGPDEIEQVMLRLNSLKVPVGAVDQVTKMWPSHKSETKPDTRCFDFLLDRFPEYAKLYGYK